jgi:hypothetical protein
VTKRRLQHDLDELSEAILGELAPTDRVALMLQAQAADREDWIDRLRETCPRHTYETLDVRYTNRMQLALVTGLRAVYDLRVALQEFRYATVQRQCELALSVVAAEDDDPLVERLIDMIATPGPPPIVWVASMARDYRGYKRFATDVLGVPLADWLGVHPDGPAIAETTAEVVDMHEGMLGADDAEVGADGMDVDEAADALFESLVEEWEALDGALWE